MPAFAWVLVIGLMSVFGVAELHENTATLPSGELPPLLGALTLSAWVFPGTRAHASTCILIGASDALQARVCVNVSAVSTEVRWNGGPVHYSSMWRFTLNEARPVWQHIGILLPTMCESGTPTRERVLVNGSDATRTSSDLHACSSPTYMSMPYSKTDVTISFDEGVACEGCLVPLLGTLTVWLAYNAQLCLTHTPSEVVCAHPKAMWLAEGVPVHTCTDPPHGTALGACYGSTATDGAWAWGDGSALAPDPAQTPALPIPGGGTPDNALCTENAVDCAGVYMGSSVVYDAVDVCNFPPDTTPIILCGNPTTVNCTGLLPDTHESVHNSPAYSPAGTLTDGGIVALASVSAVIVMCVGIVIVALVGALCVVTNRCDRAVVARPGRGQGRRRGQEKGLAGVLTRFTRQGKREAAGVPGETWCLVDGNRKTPTDTATAEADDRTPALDVRSSALGVDYDDTLGDETLGGIDVVDQTYGTHRRDTGAGVLDTMDALNLDGVEQLQSVDLT